MGRTAPPREGRGSLSEEDLAQALDAIDPPAVEPPAPEDPRMGIPEGWPMIHTLMSRILADVGPVMKDQVNTAQKYNFRGVDQVVNAVNAAFKKHRVYITSKVVEGRFQDTVTTANKPTREVTGRICFTFHAPDGSASESEVMTEALDQSDKGGPKAMSVALRICLLQALLLPTTDPTTDDDGHYHTRDGVGSMSAPVAQYVLDRLCVAELDEILEKLRPIIDAHAAWDRTVPSGGGTWQYNFIDRTAWIIGEVSSYEEGATVKEKLEAHNLLGAKTQGGQTMAELLKLRGQVLKEMYAKTLDHVTGQILKARGRDELDIAIGCGWAALEAGTIREKGLQEALKVAEERREKLPDFAPQPEGDEPDGPGGAEENRDGEPDDSVPFDGPYVPGTEPDEEKPNWTREERAEAFKAFSIRAANAAIAGVGEVPSIRADIVKRALIDLLVTPEDTRAADFGTDGFVIVQDAIKAAHRREGSIGETERAAVEEVLARCVTAAVDAAPEY
jgi:hypothetical protein